MPKNPYQDSPLLKNRILEIDDKISELRLFGVNACRAAFVYRPNAIRKVYLHEDRLNEFKDVLAWCAKHKVGYKFIDTESLSKVSASSHHEGVCFSVIQKQQPDLKSILQESSADRALLLLLDGVGNPHNFGAVLRIAAHFAADAVLLPPESTLTLSGATCRVAEGAAEAVPVVRLNHTEHDLVRVKQAGFTIAATLVDEGKSLYTQNLPAKLLMILGAEDVGMSPQLTAAATMQISIPGSGLVQSLNIASATAVLAGEFWRQHPKT